MSYSNRPFFQQALLMIDCLPSVFSEECFALKGGTAINLFVMDLPRLSVDIDLVYLPLHEFEESQQKISEALERIAMKLEKAIPRSKVLRTFSGDKKTILKLNLQLAKTSVVVEPNFVIRGALDIVESKALTKLAETAFERVVKVKSLSDDELFAGKFCAALDRQHPRDLFDVKMFLEKHKITPKLKNLFFAYLLCSGRPIHEVLFPTEKDISVTYEREFKNMTTSIVPLEVLLQARKKLITEIHSKITEGDKKFLISFNEGTPQWDLLGLSGADKFPGIQWKSINLEKFRTGNVAKFKKQHEELLAKLSSI